jgi:hypothetical protein
MKRFLRNKIGILIIGGLISVFWSNSIQAQCPGPTNNFLNFSTPDLTPTVQGEAGTVLDSLNWGAGDYWKLQVQQGEKYLITTCDLGNVYNPIPLLPWPNVYFDPQITLHHNVNGSIGADPTDTIVGYNDNHDGIWPEIEFEAPFSGEVLIVMDSSQNCNYYAVDSIHIAVTWLFGCDDTYNTIDVSVDNSYTSPSGKVWACSGQYMDTIPNQEGCDSVLTINLTVQDLVPPTVVTQDVTVYLDANGEAIVTAEDIDNGSTDDCGVASLSLSQTNFDCSDLASSPVNVMLTVTDNNNNQNTGNALVTVLDTINPVIALESFPLYLDETGSITLTNNDFEVGISDNCDISDVSSPYTEFTCDDLLGVPASYQVTDVSIGGSDELQVFEFAQSFTPTQSGNLKTFYCDLQPEPGNSVFDTLKYGIYIGSSPDEMEPLVYTSTSYALNAITQKTYPNVMSITLYSGVQYFFVAEISSTNSEWYTGVGNNDDGETLYHKVNGEWIEVPGKAAKFSTRIQPFVPIEGELSITDAGGNNVVKEILFDLQDTIAPVAIAQNLNVPLGVGGEVTISADDIDNGSYDNCDIASMSISKNTFTCDDGVSEVTLTVTDISGNVDTAVATVTIQEFENPIAIAQDLTVYLDANGEVNILPEDVNNGSTDNCGIASMTLSDSSFTCVDIANNPHSVTFTVADGNGNSDNVQVDITVLDTISPAVEQNELFVYIDESGQGQITEEAVQELITDNCSTSISSISTENVDCSQVGLVHGPQFGIDIDNYNYDPNSSGSQGTDVGQQFSPTNSGTLEAFVIYFSAWVDFFEQPIPIQVDVSILSGEIDGNVLWSKSNITTSFDSNYVVLDMPIQLLEGEKYTLKVEGITGNPHNNKIVTHDEIEGMKRWYRNTGAWTLLGYGGIQLRTYMQTEAEGVTTDIEVVDPSGNSTLATIPVSVLDTISPIAIAQNISIPLDINGEATITAQDVDNGSFDNCSIESYEISKDTFTCDDGGEQEVTLSVTDASGNVGTSICTVTITESTPPTAIAQDLTVYLDENGQAIISASEVDNGSSDNCGDVILSLSQNDFDCNDIENPVQVQLTAADNTGNQSVVESEITILDTIPPVLEVQNTIIYLGTNGEVTLTLDDVITSSSDNCDVAEEFLSRTIFDCDDVDIPVHYVDVEILDGSGNNTIKSVEVVVMDTISPTVVVNDQIVELDENGQGSYNIVEATWGTHDNCYEIGGTNVFSQIHFTCDELGENEVTYTNSDGNGNSASGTFTVTVVDVLPPVVTTQDVTVYLDENGQVSITADMIHLSSIDACTEVDPNEFELSQYDFTCEHLGPNEVTLTVYDAYGNAANEIAIVTVVDDIAPYIEDVVSMDPDMGGNCNTVMPDFTQILEIYDNCQLQILEQIPMPGTEYLIEEQVIDVSVTAVDMYGNESVETFTVTMGDPWKFDITGVDVTHISNCPEYPDVYNSEIVIHTTIDSNYLHYQIHDGFWQSYNNQFIGPDAGTYTVRVHNDNGCEKEWPELVTVFPAEEIELLDVNVNNSNLCYGDANASIEIFAEGGNGLLYYSIDGGYSWSDTNLFENLLGGTYTVQIKDDGGCEYISTEIIEISQPEDIAILQVLTTPIMGCAGTTNATIEINAEGGTGNLMYSIDEGNTWSFENVFTDLGSGSYIIWVMDSNACEVSYPVPVVINEPQELYVQNVVTDAAICNEETTMLHIVAIGGSGDIQYSVDNGITWNSSNNFEILSGEVYNIMIKDSYNCEAIYSGNPVSFDAIYSSPVSIEVQPTSIVCVGETITLKAVSTQVEEYLWNPGGEILPQIQVSEETGIYSYQVTILNESGCESLAQTEIEFQDCTDVNTQKEAKVFIHPNPSDGFFVVAFESFKVKSIRIMDTEGRIVKEVDPQNIIERTSIDIRNLSSGVYYIECVDFDNHRLIRKLIVAN